jgi:hypothetical protein
MDDADRMDDAERGEAERVEAEREKVIDFEHHVNQMVLRAAEMKQTQINKSQFHRALAARFGHEWFEAQCFRIPNLVAASMKRHNSRFNHFTVCIQGMSQSAIEKHGTVCSQTCRTELVPLFGEVWYDEHESLIPGIIDSYIGLVNEFGIQHARIIPTCDMPLAIPSSQGMLPNCTMHAVAFAISAHLYRLYGQAYAIQRDQLVHVMQAVCGSWEAIALSAFVRLVQSKICDNKEVWFSNAWSDRRLRIKVSCTRIDFDAMVVQLRDGMAIPTVIQTNTANHAVCAVQVLENVDGRVDKAEALNSYGRFQPIVIVTQRAPEKANEFLFKYASLLNVRIVEVRAGDSSVMPVPPANIVRTGAH